jgi:hypothetical protein
MEERRWGEGDVAEWPPSYGTLSELRFCQKSLGEEPESTGDDWNGDESLLSADFYNAVQIEVSQVRRRATAEKEKQGVERKWEEATSSRKHSTTHLGRCLEPAWRVSPLLGGRELR